MGQSKCLIVWVLWLIYGWQGFIINKTKVIESRMIFVFEN
jgi:hypothetical protein